ncbi:MAG: ATP synthase F0 subunit B [Thermosulfidibacteraceae bacterium]|jgi:F-type H+-transporting ATPase subunit b
MIELNYTLVIQLLIFLAVYFILDRVLYKPLFEIFDKRKELIDKRFEEARKLIEEAEKMMKLYEEGITKARQEVVRIVNEAKVKAQEEQRITLMKVRDEMEAMLNNLKTELDKEEEEAKKVLRDMAMSIASTVVEKVLGRKVEVRV